MSRRPKDGYQAARSEVRARKREAVERCKGLAQETSLLLGAACAAPRFKIRGYGVALLVIFEYAWGVGHFGQSLGIVLAALTALVWCPWLAYWRARLGYWWQPCGAEFWRRAPDGLTPDSIAAEAHDRQSRAKGEYLQVFARTWRGPGRERHAVAKKHASHGFLLSAFAFGVVLFIAGAATSAFAIWLGAWALALVARNWNVPFAADRDEETQ